MMSRDLYLQGYLSTNTRLRLSLALRDVGRLMRLRTIFEKFLGSRSLELISCLQVWRATWHIRSRKPYYCSLLSHIAIAAIHR